MNPGQWDPPQLNSAVITSMPQRATLLDPIGTTLSTSGIILENVGQIGLQSYVQTLQNKLTNNVDHVYNM